MNFVALDFETANYKRNSACAIGLVVVEEGNIIDRQMFLIRPPSHLFAFTYLHGISWDDVKSQPTFDVLWPRLKKIIGNRPVAAHNASFDASVLRETLRHYGKECPKMPCVCTCQLSRRIWPGLTSHSLDSMAGYLNLPLKHHNAISDSEVCAKIALHACRKGAYKSLIEAACGCGVRDDYLNRR